MISQPRIAVLGLSQQYVFMCLDDGLLVVVVLGFELYLQFKLRFKPSKYLYLRTSSKTKDRYLGLLQSLLSHYSSSLIRLPRGLASTDHRKGAKCLRTLCSRQESSLCLVSRVTLRSSTFASSIVYLAKSHVSRYITHLPKSGVRL